MGNITDLPIWNFTAEQHTTIRDHADKAIADGSTVSKTILSLFATIVEQAEAVLIILQCGHVGGVQAIERSMLEAFIDLKILTVDGAYRYNMEAAYHTQRLKLINAGITGNMFLPGFSERAFVAERKAESEIRIKELKNAGHHKLSVESRFKKADFADAYGSIYASLCSETHNDLGALVKRHVQQKGDGDIEFHLWQQPDKYEQILILDSIAGIEGDANLITHEYFRSQSIDMFRKWKERLEEIRRAYPT